MTDEDTYSEKRAVSLITAEQLRKIMPGLKRPTAEVYIGHLNAAMEAYAITTPQRQAAFLAQVAHESGELKWWAELWGPTDAQRRYEPPNALAAKLGNTEPGDGKRFRGRGADSDYRAVQLCQVQQNPRPRRPAAGRAGVARYAGMGLSIGGGLLG